jgi:hypothetical protein
LHDQISYTISPEYFTRVKFRQFAFADFGLPARVFAAEVGFLATWWVGLIAGWLLARAGLAELAAAGTWRAVVRAFALVTAIAILSGAAGALLGAAMTRGDELNNWQSWRDRAGVQDLRAFVIVAYLHWGSYAGAVLGFTIALLAVRRSRVAFLAIGNQSVT